MNKRYALGKNFIAALVEVGLVPPETRAVHLHATIDGILEVEIEMLGLADWTNRETWLKVAGQPVPDNYHDTPPPTDTILEKLGAKHDVR